MSIFFGRENRIFDKHLNEAITDRTALVPVDWRQLGGSATSLIDLRSPGAFRTGFIPGSYNVPDITCLAAAKRSGLFRSRNVYVLADDLAQLRLCSESNLGEGVEITGWFGHNALQEWRKLGSSIGSLEAISDNTLALRLAAWNTVVIDVYEGAAICRPGHPESLRFRLQDLPLGLEGLPAETSICVAAPTCGLASYAASLLWNSGFHRVACLSNAVLQITAS